MKPILNIVLAALLGLAAGCATSSPEAAHSCCLTSTCYVCQYNHDLACVCVKVKDTTPKAEYQGKTYYFCSEECCAAFLKKPGKYLSKAEPK
jgi:YHS domain-containing protein